MSVNRPPLAVGLVAGSNGAGPLTVAGAQIGDLIVVVQSTGAVPAVDTFERVVSVAGQVQQNSAANLSGNNYTIWLFPQGWKSIQ